MEGKEDGTELAACLGCEGCPGCPSKDEELKIEAKKIGRNAGGLVRLWRL
jgi:hypothetical protein